MIKEILIAGAIVVTTAYSVGSTPMDDDRSQHEIESEFKRPPLPKPRPIKPSIISGPMEYYNNQQFICLAKNIYFESRGEVIAGQYAVGLVTLNRVRSKRFPNDICSVVYQARYWNNHPVRNKCHFSWYCDGKSDRPRNKDKWLLAQEIAETLLLFNIEDITKGATHYHAKEVLPHWADKSKILTIIGNHIFYE